MRKIVRVGVLDPQVTGPAGLYRWKVYRSHRHAPPEPVDLFRSAFRGSCQPIASSAWLFGGFRIVRGKR